MRVESVPDTIITVEELEAIDLPGKSTELVRGRLVVREPPSTYHGKIAAKLGYLLGDYVYPHDLGVLFGQDTGFKIESNPDTVRAPDAAFLSKERAAHITRRGYAALAPNLTAEILSPDDRPGEVLTKVGDWLRAGVQIVWVIDPERAEAHIHRADGSLSVVHIDGALDGEDVLPGFSCPLSQILER
jgi:Uma2 family endonuclease